MDVTTIAFGSRKEPAGVEYHQIQGWLAGWDRFAGSLCRGEKFDMSVPTDEAKLGELMGRMVGYMTGGAMCFSIWLGDELGIYRVLEGAGPLKAEQVADQTGCHPRLVREWLDGQAAGGLVSLRAPGRHLRAHGRRRPWPWPMRTRRCSWPEA